MADGRWFDDVTGGMPQAGPFEHKYALLVWRRFTRWFWLPGLLGFAWASIASTAHNQWAGQVAGLAYFTLLILPLLVAFVVDYQDRLARHR